MSRYFVTGTDTNVGKTLVTTALLAKVAAAGGRCFGLKPVAAGAEAYPEGWRNEDAVAIQAVGSVPLSYDQINPVLLRAPLSPHLAAQREGRRLAVDRLVGLCRGALLNKADLVLVEGAGGWEVPINDRETMADLAVALQLPVILVVGLRLGCLNHALLTASAIRRDGLRLAGWVANRLDPEMQAVEENIETLRRHLPAPLLGCLPYQPGITQDEAKNHLDMESLLQNVRG